MQSVFCQDAASGKFAYSVCWPMWQTRLLVGLMNSDLREGESDTGLVEGIVDSTIQVEIHIPIVGRSSPCTNHQIDRTVGQLNEGGIGLRNGTITFGVMTSYITCLA